MSRIKYYSRIRAGQELKSLRYQMIRYALNYGIKPAARLFGTTAPTVRKWVRRWRNNPQDFPMDARHAYRPRQPRLTTEQKQQALRLKTLHPGWGALRIKHHYNLELSDKAIRKAWKELR